MLLSDGRDIFGIAVDDAHHFQGEFAAERANPGRGWLMVKVDKLTPLDVLNNITQRQLLCLHRRGAGRLLR